MQPHRPRRKASRPREHAACGRHEPGRVPGGGCQLSPRPQASQGGARGLGSGESFPSVLAAPTAVSEDGPLPARHSWVGGGSRAESWSLSPNCVDFERHSLSRRAFVLWGEIISSLLHVAWRAQFTEQPTSPHMLGTHAPSHTRPLAHAPWHMRPLAHTADPPLAPPATRHLQPSP